jgi:hypothetical protein
MVCTVNFFGGNRERHQQKRHTTFIQLPRVRKSGNKLALLLMPFRFLPIKSPQKKHLKAAMMRIAID